GRTVAMPARPGGQVAWLCHGGPTGVEAARADTAYRVLETKHLRTRSPRYGGCGVTADHIPAHAPTVPVRSSSSPARRHGAWGAAPLARVTHRNGQNHCLCPPGPAAPRPVPHPGPPR